MKDVKPNVLYTKETHRLITPITRAQVILTWLTRA
jgi:hypothetical protein